MTISESVWSNCSILIFVPLCAPDIESSIFHVTALKYLTFWISLNRDDGRRGPGLVSCFPPLRRPILNYRSIYQKWSISVNWKMVCNRNRDSGVNQLSTRLTEIFRLFTFVGQALWRGYLRWFFPCWVSVNLRNNSLVIRIRDNFLSANIVNRQPDGECSHDRDERKSDSDDTSYEWVWYPIYFEDPRYSRSWLPFSSFSCPTSCHRVLTVS